MLFCHVPSMLMNGCASTGNKTRRSNANSHTTYIAFGNKGDKVRHTMRFGHTNKALAKRV